MAVVRADISELLVTASVVFAPIISTLMMEVIISSETSALRNPHDVTSQ
jgi:hypothetical protein